MKNKSILFTMLAAGFLLLVMSCRDSDKAVREKTEKAMIEANHKVGYPAVTNFQEKKLMKMIYELRDREDLVCYAYLVNEYTGKVGQFLGKSIGYGLPYSTQFSNPEKRVSGYNIAQPEPNGLFMPEGLAATWLLLIDPETGDPRPVYVEPSIIVSPFPPPQGKVNL